MAEYANTHVETYVKEADLKQQIVMENPVPDNLDQVKKLDDFVRDILKDQRKQKDLDMDVTFGKIQSKNTSVMSPLSKLWMLVGEANRSKEKQISIDKDNIRAYIEETVLFLDQTSNYIPHFRRYSIFAALHCPAQHSKKMLREDADLLQRHNIFLAKSLANTLRFQLNKKNRPLKYLLKGQVKTKALSEYPFRGAEEEFWRTEFEIFPRQKIWEIKAKNICRKLPLSNWKEQ